MLLFRVDLYHRIEETLSVCKVVNLVVNSG